MRCLSPHTVGFLSDGKTISWSKNCFSKEYPAFKLPCGKCLECRLQYARSWAIRCAHEAQIHEDNSFVTLTYTDQNLPALLDYSHFQNFMKRLRKTYPNQEIGVFVCGEYSKILRPHWHAILFGFRPTDLKFHKNSGSGHPIYSSESLDKIWGHGFTWTGDVTEESANYVARYAVKKIGTDVMGLEPICRQSRKYAIGRRWIEKFWPDVFNLGYVVTKNGTKTAIPRYYEKWFKENHFDEWLKFQTRKLELITRLTEKERVEGMKWWEIVDQRIDRMNYIPYTTKRQHRRRVIESKIKILNQGVE